MKRVQMWIVGISVMIVLGMVLVGCSWFGDDSDSPTAPQSSENVTEVDVADQNRYDQSDHEEPVEQTVNNQTYTIHVSRDESWVCYPYDEWVYLEINKQMGTGDPAGTSQVNVDVSDVVLHFSNIPADVTSVVVGVETAPKSWQYNEVGTYAVSGGAVSIPVDYADLAAVYGPTHYSIWFKLVGGKNGQGCDDVMLTVTGTHMGQALSVTRELKFGSDEPEPINESSSSSIIALGFK